MADICRFCLSEEQDPSNPFVSPCLCIGSMKYVHRECLNHWRNTVQVDQHKTNCQACNAPYNLPRRWPLEVIPAIYKIWTLFLNHTFLLIAVVHYIHLILLLQAYDMKSMPTNPVESALVIHSQIGIKSYNCLLALSTGIYLFYYYHLFSNVVNKARYLYYCSFDLTKFLVGAAGCLYLTQQTIFPFGGLYIYLLTFLHSVHYQTLDRLNADGVM